MVRVAWWERAAAAARAAGRLGGWAATARARAGSCPRRWWRRRPDGGDAQWAIVCPFSAAAGRSGVAMRLADIYARGGMETAVARGPTALGRSSRGGQRSRRAGQRSRPRPRKPNTHRALRSTTGATSFLATC